ncbi:hypothetical protein C9374_012799 [Naegleria lovaniensis]|uniref:BRCT domain-containing protein n=1 Tax=Naegleria lovaniensis TaxID=51637 RepID=A0AA88GCQ2_NAELO|nr:uncharacterized protein C9374_012799 [Naegleria lovaniensis]KAG2373197.1 hypothetical protein C9374_012799 [Naegleria lovaniensis]
MFRSNELSSPSSQLSEHQQLSPLYMSFGEDENEDTLDFCDSPLLDFKSKNTLFAATDDSSSSSHSQETHRSNVIIPVTSEKKNASKGTNLSSPLKNQTKPSKKKIKTNSKIVAVKKKVEFKDLESSSETDDEKKVPQPRKNQKSNSSNNVKKSLSRQLKEMIQEVKQRVRLEQNSDNDDFQVSEEEYVLPPFSQELISSEEEIEEEKKRKKPHRKKRIFSDIHFVVSSSLVVEKDKEALDRMIKKENGTIMRQLSSELMDTYLNKKIVLLSEKSSTKPTFLIALLLDIPILKPQWIFDCSNQHRLILEDPEIKKYLVDRGSYRLRSDPSIQHVEQQTFNQSLLCCNIEHRIFYGCKVKIIDNSQDQSLIAGWSGILKVGGATIEHNLENQTNEGSNFIFVKDGDEVSSDICEMATQRRLPILDRESILKITITSQREFSSEQVINFTQLSKTIAHPSRSINRTEIVESISLVDLQCYDMCEEVIYDIEGSFFFKEEQNCYLKTKFIRINRDGSNEIYRLHDMVLLNDHNDEIFCRIDSLYYDCSFPSMTATQYINIPNSKELVATRRSISSPISLIQHKLHLCSNSMSQECCYIAMYNTQNIDESPHTNMSKEDALNSIEDLKNFSFQWLAPVKISLFKDYVSICSLKFRGQIFQKGDFVIVNTLHSSITGRIKSFRDSDTSNFAFPSKKYPVSEGSMFIEVFVKGRLESQLVQSQQQGSVLIPTHEVICVKTYDIRHIQHAIAIDLDSTISNMPSVKSLLSQCQAWPLFFISC